MKNPSKNQISDFKQKGIQVLILFSFLFISLGVNATKNQIPDYKELWKKADSLIEKGLPKSALEVVNQIYKFSKVDKSPAVFVKSVIYKIKLEQNLTEEFYSVTIKSLNEEVKTSSMPVKPVIHTLLAEMYWRYYMTNRNRFKNRTETVSFKQEDIATWDLKKIINKTIEHFVKSIESADSLKKIPINTYDDIITIGDNSRKFRPTLYDFLAHRLIDFFMNDEPDIIRPSYKFEVNDPNFILPLNNFANYNLQSKDSFSLKFYALKTIQDLIKFHLNDADPTALIDIELQRLGYIRTKAVFENKDSLYLDNLINLEKKFINSPASADITYEIANYYFVLGSKYNPLASDENKWMKKKAFDKCKEAIAAYSSYDGGRNCSYLQDRILSKSMSFSVENANLPNQPFRALLSYTNMKEVFVRVVPIDPDNFKRKRYDYSDNNFKTYVKVKPIKEWVVKLEDDGDYQNHKVELNIPELPIGLYAILVGSEKNFSTEKEAVAYSSTWITNLSFISRKKENGNYDITVLNRDNGLPVKNVSTQTYSEKYNYVLREYRFEKGDKFTTDQNGSFEIPAKGDDYSYFYIDFVNGKDRIQSDYNFYQYRYYRDNNHEKVITTSFFLDRAIYRPGQTIFFKGIVLESDSISTEIKANFKSTVILYDVNYQKVGELNLTSNEYGSFNGSFVAPTGVLNGQMQITDGHGSVYFSVEEYKRPKFEVTVKPVKGIYKLNEKITVKGSAKAYAGSNIDNAEVKYRVVRTASFPYWWYWWSGYSPSSPQLEITNGTAITDENGDFSIDFIAIPDMSISKKQQPTFNYLVYFDVTDVNGESHSVQQNVSVAYTALNVSVSLPSQIDKASNEKYVINTTNTNGVYEYAMGNIVVYKLKEPDRTFRTRKWERPDRFLMTKEAFYKLYPNDVYDDENNLYKFEKLEKVLDISFDTKKDSLLSLLNLKNWNQGQYVLEIKSKDKFNQKVESYNYFTVIDNNEKITPTVETDWFNLIKNAGEPGDKAKFSIGTRENDVNVLYEIEHKGRIISKQWLALNNEQKNIEVPILEAFRGNFCVHFTFIKNNRNYQHDAVITVPYSNKQLDLEFETFRNKLLPGQKEEWKIKIKNKKGDKIAAELLAGMYDASLDAFKPNSWWLSINKTYYSTLTWDTYSSFVMNNSTLSAKDWNPYSYYYGKYYDQLNWFGIPFYNNYYSYGWGNRDDYFAYDQIQSVVTGSAGALMPGREMDNRSEEQSGGLKDGPNPPVSVSKISLSEQSVTKGLGDITTLNGKDGENRNGGVSGVVTRTNFNETAFFFPNLMTDENGSVIISFTIPEALTKWKFMGLAHTKDLKVGQIQKEVVTQKELMVMTNPPRFLREGDRISFTSKVSNLTDKDMVGEAKLMMFDASTMKPIDSLLNNYASTITFVAKKGQSAGLSWNLTIPEGIGAITYKVVAKSGAYSDGEEMAIPVLTNRMLVTESLPLPIRGKQTKTYNFTKLINSKSSTTLRNHKLTLEFTSNPAWYAIQALPYLMEYPYECAEQTFNRFYANSIASFIANSTPKIKAVFDNWKNFSPDALLSNLEKNQDLKSIVLEETPWVLDAKDESQRKQRIALLFDLNKMSNELDRALRKLEKFQVSNGGFPWFAGMPDDRYITQYIVCGMGHLNKLGIKNVKEDPRVWKMVKAAADYLDDRTKEDYDYIKKWYPNKLNENHLGFTQIQYLYARSYFLDVEVKGKNQEAFNYYKGQAKKYWLDNSRYMQGMIALSLNRYNEKPTAAGIIKSLKENAIHSEEMGMYWNDMNAGYYWYQAPIETQALLIEAFDEVANDQIAVEDLKVWLLKQKQTQDWKTTTATAEACYALLLKGTNLLADDELVEVSLGDIKIEPKKMDNVKVEAGTGYFKTSWSGSDIKPEMGNVKVTKNTEGVAWGAVYWQYFEQLDKITPAATPLKLDKKLFVERNTPSGPVLEPITEATKLKVGDKIKARIELRVDRNMEYVHMKDMRASGFEPVNVISQYKYQDGLGYYESTKDASTNFFFSYLNKGTYVFEYAMKVTNKGDFSNGVTTIQCMYAPEFTSHSEGIRVKVGE